MDLAEPTTDIRCIRPQRQNQSRARESAGEHASKSSRGSREMRRGAGVPRPRWHQSVRRNSAAPLERFSHYSPCVPCPEARVTGRRRAESHPGLGSYNASAHQAQTLRRLFRRHATRACECPSCAPANEAASAPGLSPDHRDRPRYPPPPSPHHLRCRRHPSPRQRR